MTKTEVKMIRGTQRQMIMVKTDKSSIFESACFLIRPNISEPSPNNSDMLREANRIIDENYSSKSRRKHSGGKHIRDNIPTFLLGNLCGALLLGLILLLCTLK